MPRRAVAVAALALALAACAPTGEPPAEVAMEADACGAGALQGLVGTSVGTLDAASLPEPRRILFPGDAATMDFAPGRLNVVIDASDRVERVFCG